MDLKILKDIINVKSVPALNRIAGTNFNIDDPIEVVKTKILRDVCEEHYVRLCESIEEQVISIVEHKKVFTDDQELLINILVSNGYYAVPLEPELKEDVLEDHEDKFINEAKLIKESNEKELKSEEIHKHLVEHDVIDDNVELLIEKLKMCPYFTSLIMMDGDFNSVGLSIHESNNNIMLCKIDDDGNLKNDKIFEDYMVLASNDTIKNRELTDRIVECIIRFIKKSSSTPKSKKTPEESWNTGPKPYGDAVGLDTTGSGVTK